MTDPSLLIKTANSSTEAFLVVTDNEVNSGTHPALELKNHRQRTGHDAKLVVMGMSATDFTIANPNDPGMMDVVGFDASAPKVVSDFISGKI
jgi:60 kDa SS-A/Ro ribonucleoprotein